MSSITLPTPEVARPLDRRGQRRSPATIAGFKPKRPPATKGREMTPDAPPVEDVVAFLQAASVAQRHGRLGELSALRLKTIAVLMWRSGLRISEALDLEERDLDRRNRSMVVRSGKGGKRRIVMMDSWAWEQLEPWLKAREEFPPGPVFCVIYGPTAGCRMAATYVRAQFRDANKRSGVRRHIHPHSMRHACAVDGHREGFSLITVQRQLGHVRLSTTQIYLASLAAPEVLKPFGERPAPTMPLPPI